MHTSSLWAEDDHALSECCCQCCVDSDGSDGDGTSRKPSQRHWMPAAAGTRAGWFTWGAARSCCGRVRRTDNAIVMHAPAQAPCQQRGSCTTLSLAWTFSCMWCGNGIVSCLRHYRYYHCRRYIGSSLFRLEELHGFLVVLNDAPLPSATT